MRRGPYYSNILFTILIFVGPTLVPLYLAGTPQRETIATPWRPRLCASRNALNTILNNSQYYPERKKLTLLIHWLKTYFQIARWFIWWFARKFGRKTVDKLKLEINKRKFLSIFIYNSKNKIIYWLHYKFIKFVSLISRILSANNEIISFSTKPLDIIFLRSIFQYFTISVMYENLWNNEMKNS